MPSPKLIAIATALLIVLTVSLSLPRLSSQPKIATRQSPSASPSCTINGNSDLYGLGIRLGIYLQLFASYIANQFKSNNDVSALLDTNSTLMAALLIAVLVISATREVYVEEVFVVL